ncbi:MAG TPA: DinB family protein, partial [Vicinamibacterales bacterium]|nr:DinB family protein [Vicinamibacterales bacterium]
MHPRIDELIRHIDTHQADFRRAYESVPKDQRNTKPAADRWSAANIVEHVAIVNGRVAGRLAKQIADARAAGHAAESAHDPILPTIDLARVLDRSPERRVQAPDPIQPTGLDADAAWAALEKSSSALRDALASGDGLALGTLMSPHPLFGDLSIYQWAAFVGAHQGRHAAQLRELGS